MSRVVVITGASRGLGLSLTKKFLECGDRVLGLSRTEHGWKSASKHLAFQENFSRHILDITQEAAVVRFVRSLKKETKKVDILINNAGYGGTLMRTEDHSLGEFQKHLDTNLISTFLMSKHLIPLFRKQKKGMIFNLSSMAGKRGVPRLAAYSASKFAVIGLTQCMAKENTDVKLCCITICPGGMNTRMRAILFGNEDAKKQQSTEFVAGQILKIANQEWLLPSGSDIVIRHGRVTSVDTPPSI